MLTEFLEAVRGLERQKNVTTLSLDDLAERAPAFGRRTASGGMGFFSNVRNRSAAVSVVFGGESVGQTNLTPAQQAIHDNVEATLKTVREYLKVAPLICVKRTIGDNGAFEPKCMLYLSVQRSDNVRQAHLWSRTLKDFDAKTPGPDLRIICIPEWPEQGRQVLLFPEEGLTVMLGSDYVGEVKMGFLRLAMWEAKQAGMLALHAGSKVVKARRPDGSIKRYGMLLFGLSGTGKTTHACHDHGLTGDGEGIEILQDDIVFLRPDGSALGTEQGFYLKTEGISSEHQPIIYKGLMTREALFENVVIDAEGTIDFTNMTLGSNGRAVIPRSVLAPHLADGINLPPLDQLDGLVVAFITRRMTVLPIASRLTAEQAAATFMLGESIETSAGDPRRAGQSVRVVGTNPFIIGDQAREGNWFYDFLKSNEDKVQCYLLNTGGVGQLSDREEDGRFVVKRKPLRVEIPEMAAIIRGLASGTVEWTPEEAFGTRSPASVEGVDMGKFDLEHHYSAEQASEYISTLRQERREWLSRFPALHKDVADSLA
ncbi:MAG: phosphoenolpyruvate carboxykinase [Dehalococcoidia bacterium]